MKLEPDVVVSVDDDNEPMGAYFADLEHSFAGDTERWAAKDHWFNLGGLGKQAYRYRGLSPRQPISARLSPKGKPSRIGVVNGLIYGDPDINATERLERDPHVWDYEQTAKDGIAVDPRHTWTPINSQNTAWRAELAPLMMVLPGVGRYDDVFGSYIAQKVLAARGERVLFGRPFVRHQRHPHDVLQDIEDELYGMRNTAALIRRLEEIEVRGGTVIEQLESVLAAGPDIVLLDNMSAGELHEAVAIRDRLAPGIELEASGGISLETVREVALAGVERISVGALTHSAPWLDVGLDFRIGGKSR